MTTSVNFLTSPSGAARTSGLLWLLLVILLSPILRAEDNKDSTDRMLDNLKRRTAQERWDRMKKAYPTGAPNRPSGPAEFHSDGKQGDAGFEVPPSPQEASLIPRMSPIADDHTNDWVLPARTAPIEESAVAGDSGTYESGEISTAPATVKIAAQDPPAEQTTVQPTDPALQRALHERKINEIAPYYDRERDSDIRNFAIEKGRELDIEFKPKPFVPRSFPEIVLAWEATNFTYRPLYFSDPALERYGHSHHPVIQPIASIARFGAQFCFWPYQATITPPCKEESPLGYYRPGDVIPKLHYQIPLNAEAAAVQAGVVTGLYFIIP